jgi:hypothetical protein
MVAKPGADRRSGAGLQPAGFRGRTCLQAHPAACPRHPVRRRGAVVQTQPLELPFAPRQHVDSAVATHQDGKFAILAAVPRGGENLFRMLQKPAHKTLIVRPSETMSARSGLKKPPHRPK